MKAARTVNWLHRCTEGDASLCATERLMAVEAQVDKQLKLRARLVMNLLALIKDSVRPSNMAEFLVSTVELPGFAACSNTNSLIGRYRF